MALGKQNQEKFIGQVEAGLDAKITDLAEADQKREALLQKLKTQILREISESTNSYLGDGDLDNADWKAFYQNPVIARQANKLGLKSLDEFLKYFNVYYYGSNGVYSANELDEIEINGFKPKIEGVKYMTQSATGTGIVECFKRIEEKGVGVGEDTVFRYRGGVMIEFSIEIGGIEVSYLALPHGVLLVKKGVPEGAVRVGNKNKLELKKKQKQILRKLEQLKVGNSDEVVRGILNTSVGKGRTLEEYFATDFPELVDVIAEFDVWDLVEEKKRLRDALRWELYDEDRGVEVSMWEVRGSNARSFRYDRKIFDELGLSRINYCNDSYSEVFESRSGEVKRKYVQYNGFTQQISSKSLYGKNNKNLQHESFEDGVLTRKISYLNDEDEGRIIRFYKKDEEGLDVFTHMVSGNKVISRLLVDDEGGQFGLYEYEKAQKPELTPDEYLDALALKLKTPKQLAIFFEQFFVYLHDDPAKRDATYTVPNLGGGTDYWQLPEETVQRVEKLKMLGDCDDWAFFAQAILERQGRNAHVMNIPGHAICVWVEEREDGKFDAFSIGTFGLDVNGRRYGMKGVNKNVKDGFSTLKDAVNSLMVKYDKSGLGRESDGRQYRVEESIDLLFISEKGKHGSASVPLEVLLNKELSRECYEVFLLMAMGNGAVARDVIFEMLDKGSVGEGLLEGFLTKFPTRKAGDWDIKVEVMRRAYEKGVFCKEMSNQLIPKLEEEGDYEGGVQIMEYLYEKRGDEDFGGLGSVRFYDLLIDVYEKAGRSEDADRVFREALEHPTTGGGSKESFYLKYARTLIGLGKLESAKRYCDEMLNDDGVMSLGRSSYYYEILQSFVDKGEEEYVYDFMEKVLPSAEKEKYNAMFLEIYVKFAPLDRAGGLVDRLKKGEGFMYREVVLKIWEERLKKEGLGE